MSGMSWVGNAMPGWERGQTLSKTKENSEKHSQLLSVCVHICATWVIVTETYLYVRGWVSDVQGLAQAATQTFSRHGACGQEQRHTLYSTAMN